MSRNARAAGRAARRREPQPDPHSAPHTKDELQTRLAEAERQVTDWERRFRQLDAHLMVLERERQKLSAVMNYADAAFLVIDAEFRLTWANPLLAERYPVGPSGTRSAPGPGGPCRDLLCAGDATCRTCAAHLAFAQARVAHSEMKLQVDGRERHIYATAMPIRTPSGAIEEVLVMLQDVSDLEVLRRSQEALRNSEERFRSIFENTSAGMAAVGHGGTLLQVNPAFCRFLGRDETELTGRELGAITHLDDRVAATRLFAEAPDAPRAPLLVELRYLRPSGAAAWGLTSITWLRDAAGRPTYAVALVQDIDERKQAEEALRKSEEQLRQSQKMEAIGRLAGGVAHDFNNMLTVITGRCALLLRRADDTLPRREIEVIRDTADRAAALTRQLLAFSRKQVLMPRVVDLNVIVGAMLPMLRPLVGEDVQLVSSLRPGLGLTRVDPSQIEQILMNLAINARDAMPGGGRIAIETANVTLSAESHLGEVQVVSGSYVLLAVSDSGCGMDAATRARIFEPFFTTKAPGQGTGLGLSTVYGIVKQSGGYIFVYSEPGRGSTFKIYLPCEDPAAVAALAQRGTDDRVPRGTGTILLVEDEEVVRNLAREILEQVGYTVLPASGAAEARRLCETHPGEIHLMLTDVVMPQTGGRELAAALAPLRRDMGVLYMSGYTYDAVVLQGVLVRGTAFLQKPFTPEGLARAVRDALARRS